MDKYHPGYFGKVGMRHYHYQNNHYWKPVINLDKVRLGCTVDAEFHDVGEEGVGWIGDGGGGVAGGDHFTDVHCVQLWSLVPAEKRHEYLKEGAKKNTVPVLDLLPLGYSKVLGKGRLPEVPLVVRARWFSKEAERKITEAGGVVELVA